MAITTNAELETAVGNWLHRSDLTAIIPDLVMLGEKRIFREVRTRDMESALSVTIASGVAALPADFVELKHAYIDGTPIRTLEIRPADWIYKKFTTRSSDSKPNTVAVEGSNLIFGPYPDSAYTVKGIYYKRLTAVSSSANALFTKNPDLYLWAALAEAAPYLKNDARALVWVAKYDAAIKAINEEDKRSVNHGGQLSMRAG
jgi:hypothetical protein